MDAKYLKDTPEYLVDQGYISIPDLIRILGTSRGFIYLTVEKWDPPVERFRVGRKVYYRLAEIMDRISYESSKQRKAKKSIPR